MLYTSRFQNPELKSGNYTVVGIVRGTPRFKLGYELAGNIIDIAPTRELFKIEDLDEFAPPYKAHLNEVGFERISAQIQKYVDFGKDVVLCCYEDVRDPNEWCHRLVFAEWWFEKTGERIPELFNPAPIKTKTKSGAVKKDDSVFDPIVVPEVDSGDDKSEFTSSNNKPTIVVTYSTWWEDKDGDMYYIVNPLTGKQERIADSTAREMLINGEADLQLDYESIPKILFVLKEDSIVRVVKNRKGKETSISLEEARKLLLEGKATIEDIKIE